MLLAWMCLRTSRSVMSEFIEVPYTIMELCMHKEIQFFWDVIPCCRENS